MGGLLIEVHFVSLSLSCRSMGEVAIKMRNLMKIVCHVSRAKK